MSHAPSDTAKALSPVSRAVDSETQIGNFGSRVNSPLDVRAYGSVYPAISLFSPTSASGCWPRLVLCPECRSRVKNRLRMFWSCLMSCRARSLSLSRIGLEACPLANNAAWLMPGTPATTSFEVGRLEEPSSLRGAPNAYCLACHGLTRRSNVHTPVSTYNRFAAE